MPPQNDSTSNIESNLAKLQNAQVVTQQQPQSQLSNADYLLGLSRSYLAGPTFNFADELEAAISSPITGVPYEQELQAIQEQNKQFQNENFWTSLGTSLGSGTILNPLATVGAIGKSLPAASAAAKVLTLPGAKLAQGLGTSVPAQSFIAGYGAGEGENRLASGVLGGALGTAGSALSSIGGRILKTLGTQADRFKLSSYNLTPSDVTTNIKEAIAKTKVVPTREAIPIVSSIKKLEQEKIISPDNDVLTNLSSLKSYKDTLGIQLQNALKQANEVAEPFADFIRTNTDKYLSGISGKAKEAAAKIIAEERDAITSQFKEGGSLLDLQRAKTGLNYAWEQSPLTPSALKALRQDLREEIEDRVARLAASKQVPKSLASEISETNKIYGDAQDLSDALLSKTGRDSAGNLLEDAASQLRTSGGAGTAIQATTQSGNIIPAVAGLAMQAGRAQAGKNYLADLLSDPAAQAIGRYGGAALEEIGTGRNIATLVAPYVKQDTSEYSITPAGKVVATQPTKEYAPTDIEALLSKFGRNQAYSIDDIVTEATSQRGIKVSPELVKKVIKQESGGKADATSSKGAKGLMQLMPDTAKELGVDANDARSNVMGGVKYLNQMLNKFEDEKLALAAYNWGPANLNKAIKKVEAKGKTPTWENILRYSSVPTETENYVSSILNKG